MGSDGRLHPLHGCVTVGFWLALLALVTLAALQHYGMIPRW